MVDLIAVIAWPALIVFIVFYFNDEFRNLFREISGAIGRLRGLGRGFADFDTRPQNFPPGSPSSPPLTSEPAASQATPTGVMPAKKPARDFIGPEYRSFFDSAMQRINDNAPMLYKKVDGTREEVLKAVIAEFASAMHLERATRSIFASQIEALVSLKENTESLTKEMFRPHYEKGKQLYPHIYQNYSFDQWFQFLVAMELVSEQGGKVTITEAGKVANIYMIQQRYQAPLG